MKLKTAGLQVCREPLVGVVDDVLCLSRRCLSSPGPGGMSGHVGVNGPVLLWSW